MTFVVLAGMLTKIGAILFILTCVLLIGIILLQKGRGGGLSGAFGGAGGGHSAFGAKTGDVLTWATVALATLFLLMAIMMNFAFRPPKVVAEPPPTPGADEVGLPPGDMTAEQPITQPVQVTPIEPADTTEQPIEQAAPIEPPAEPAASGVEPAESATQQEQGTSP